MHFKIMHVLNQLLLVDKVGSVRIVIVTHHENGVIEVAVGGQ